MYFLKFAAKIPISIDFVAYFINYFKNKKASLNLKMALYYSTKIGL